MSDRIRIFISYCWDDDKNEEVRTFIQSLERKRNELSKIFSVEMQGEFEIIIDKHNFSPAKETIKEFMEREIEKADFVLIICTPIYKMKVDNMHSCNIYYEYKLIDRDIYRNMYDYRKVQPVILKGNAKVSIPSYFESSYYHDLTINADSLGILVRTLYKMPLCSKSPINTYNDEA